MNNIIAFLNSMLSYLLLMGIIVVLVSVGIFIGIKLRKAKNVSVEAEITTQE